MLTPAHHARTAAEVERYKVEPYVVAADVYGVAPHVGRGGWTWYTGSAAWMYRVALESILGITVERGKTLRIAPRIPDEWPGFKARMRPAWGWDDVRDRGREPDGKGGAAWCRWRSMSRHSACAAARRGWRSSGTGRRIESS
jgi:cyclic beta-1,2-glucan synthetase